MSTSYHSAKFQDGGMIVDFEAVISEDQKGAGLFRIKRVFRGELITDISSGNALVFGEWMRDYVGYGPAGDLLTQAGVPEWNPLWKRGIKG